MKTFWKHLRGNILKGLLAIVPIVLSYFVVKVFYMGIDQRVSGLLHQYLPFSIPGLGFLIFLVCLYLLGLIASNVVGKQILAAIDRISEKIPIVKTTYQIGKQVSSSLTLPEQQIFRRAVLVEFLKPGLWTVGFVTGSVKDRSAGPEEKVFLKVYVPTPPNPTSGFMILAEQDKVRDPGWTLEEAMKTVVSAGIIGPEEIRKTTAAVDGPA